MWMTIIGHTLKSWNRTKVPKLWTYSQKLQNHFRKGGKHYVQFSLFADNRQMTATAWKTAKNVFHVLDLNLNTRQKPCCMPPYVCTCYNCVVLPWVISSRYHIKIKDGNDKFWTLGILHTTQQPRFRTNIQNTLKQRTDNRNKAKYLFPFCFHFFICQSQLLLRIFLCPCNDLYKEHKIYQDMSTRLTFK